jgi:hypothetical protein
VNAQENKKNTILSYKRQSGKYSKKGRFVPDPLCIIDEIK